MIPIESVRILQCPWTSTDVSKYVWSFLLKLGRGLSAHVVSKCGSHSNAKETELFFGIDHSRLFVALQHKLLSVLKAILLEAKILVRSLDFPKGKAISNL